MTSRKADEKQLEKAEGILRWRLALKEAQDHLIPFAQLFMPDAQGQRLGDPLATRYFPGNFHRFLAEKLEAIEWKSGITASARSRQRKRWRDVKRNLALSVPAQHGKEIDDRCPVLTNEGWKNHGDLQVGDKVFTATGALANVTYVSEGSYSDLKVRTADGAEIIAHRDHLWVVHDRTVRDRPRTVMTTQQLLDAGLRDKRGGRRWHLPLVEPLQAPEADLPIHPYVLGAWLGGGNARAARITHAANDDEVIEAMVAAGAEVRCSSRHASTGAFDTWFTLPMRHALIGAGLLGNKHIPDVYLAASFDQRMELLAGLIDTDGYVHHESRRVCISGCDERLMRQVATLVRTFGWRATVARFEPTTSSSGIVGKKPTYQVTFSPDLPIPTRMPRKRIEGFDVQRRRIAIDSIEEVEPVRSRCIAIDHPEHVYLVGEHLTPTHNTQLASIFFLAWFIGRNPHKNVIFITYNDDFARAIGRKVKAVLTSPIFKQIFPNFSVNADSKAADAITTMDGGTLYFLGFKSGISGKPADLLIIDDPIKGREQARSPTLLQELKEKYWMEVESRCHNDTIRFVIQTRWAVDDLIGMLCDPSHPDYDPETAKDWEYINIPAIQTDPEVAALVGLQVGDALWPERHGLPRLQNYRRRAPREFEALMQGNPTPDDGELFKREMLIPYTSPGELPVRLLMYGASDHAITEKRENDPSCVGCIGVDENDEWWIMPDIVWKHTSPDALVENILAQISAHRPMMWFAEQDMIGMTLGPAIRRGMEEKGVFTMLEPVSKTSDKQAKAATAIHRAAMHKIHFPTFAPWWSAARSELLKFPMDRHDDFVDWLSIIARGLDKVRGVGRQVSKKKEAKPFTMDWIKNRSGRQESSAGRHYCSL